MYVPCFWLQPVIDSTHKMPVSILVISATAGFGQLIQQTLNDQRGYDARLVNSGEEALEQFEMEPARLCILDADLPDVSQTELVEVMRKLQPDVRLVAVSSHRNGQEAEQVDFQPDAYLSKPFYLPEMLGIVEQVLGEPDTIEREDGMHPEGQQSQTPLPAWLQDVSRAAQHLTRLSLESAAQAALIIRDGEMWAYAGELPQPAAQEIAALVANYWKHNGGSDLARFVRLESNSSEYMLYATALAGDMILAVVFESETPFSQIRSQASRLARALASPPPPEMGAVSQEVEETEEQPVKWQPLFDDVPPPTAQSPTGTPPTPPKETPAKAKTVETGYDLHGELEGPDGSAPKQDTVPNIWIPEVPDLHSEFAPKTQTRETDLGDTQPVTIRDKIESEAIPESERTVAGATVIYQLAFTGLLIPRMPKHHLVGKLASQVSTWMPEVCLAFGWRLVHLSVRPDTLLWVVEVNPSVTPADLILTVRNQTSRYIFSNFPHLADENPSGDFWAPGFLILSGSQPPSKETVQDFIRQTRQRQGISDPDLERY